MYKIRPNIMLGFHGCDESIRDALVNSPDKIKKSNKTYDWLGNGFYIWENNYERALRWAIDKQKREAIAKPSVVGVVYQLDHCLDFTDSAYIDILSKYYWLMKDDFELTGKTLPINKDIKDDIHKDIILRELDCAVIEYLHQKISEQINLDISQKGYSLLQHFDTVRGIFTEGGPVYEGAGIKSKNHIQICIRNVNCIKGFFIPRTEVKFP